MYSCVGFSINVDIEKDKEKRKWERLPAANQPREKTWSSSRARKEGSVYQELGGVTASSIGTLGSNSSTKRGNDWAPVIHLLVSGDRRESDGHQKLNPRLKPKPGGEYETKALVSRISQEWKRARVPVIAIAGESWLAGVSVSYILELLFCT